MHTQPSVWQIFYTFLRLGCSAFGGPVAHIAYFNTELIQQKQWLKQASYTHLMGLCHFIPGPTSSQVGLGIGYLLQGWKGAIAAWLGFTLPSALLMTLIAIGYLNNELLFSEHTLHYLKLIALAVVAQAIWQMSQTLLVQRLSRCLCLISAGVLLVIPGLMTQLLLLSLFGMIGFFFLKPTTITNPTDTTSKPYHYKRLLVGVVLFLMLLIILPILTSTAEHPLLTLVDSLYRSGALVFGGGHVVLPMLQQELSQHASISSESFIAGYGIAQALPGPLFTFASYIGALWLEHNPWLGAVAATTAIFLPSFILVPSLLPMWEKLQYNPQARAILSGFNTAVIGLLIAIFYNPLFTLSIRSSMDVAIVLGIFAIIHFLKFPTWALVIGTGIVGTFL